MITFKGITEELQINRTGEGIFDEHEETCSSPYSQMPSEKESQWKLCFKKQNKTWINLKIIMLGERNKT